MKSSSDICDIFTKFHMSLSPNMQKISSEASRASMEQTSQTCGKKEESSEVLSLTRQLADMQSR